MPNTIEIENIEEIRTQEGIDDVALRAEIRNLRAGDHVKLTFLSGPSSFETLLVRITSVRDLAFRGKLARKPSSSLLAHMEVGMPLIFNAGHIHSVSKGAVRNSKRSVPLCNSDAND